MIAMIKKFLKKVSGSKVQSYTWVLVKNLEGNICSFIPMPVCWDNSRCLGYFKTAPQTEKVKVWNLNTF